MSLTLIIKSLLRRKLVVGLLLVQLAVTLALLVNSGLLAQHARSLLNRETGLDLENTLFVQLQPTSPGLGQEPALMDLLERQLAALQDIDGVLVAAYTTQAPLTESGSNGTIEDLDNKELAHVDMAPLFTSSVAIFDVMGLKLIQGNLPDHLDTLMDFDKVDLATFDIKTRHVVLTQSLAKRLFGDGPAIGRFTSMGQVVAVVSDFTGQLSSEDINYNMFTVEHMNPGGVPYVLMLRTQPGMANIVRAHITDRLRAANPNINIQHIRTLAEQKDILYRYPRGLAVLLIVLSVLMLAVAMISAYSNAFFHALQQHQEIGIKRALGANKRRIFRELLAESWLATALGSALGFGCAWALNRTLALVLEIPAIPLWLPVVVMGMLIACVTLASWYPTRIAVSISPVSATKSL